MVHFGSTIKEIEKCIDAGEPVDNANFHAQYGSPECTSANLAWLKAVRKNANHLGHSPYLDEGESETLLDCLMKLWLDPGAQAEPNLM
jgi:hypothetical protein